MKPYGKKNRRRNYMSYPKAQMRIILFFGVLAVVYAVLNFYVSTRAIDAAYADVYRLEMTPSLRHDIQVVLAEHETILTVQLSLYTIMSFCMLCLGSLLLSHHIGGPIYHARMYLEGLTKGSVKPRRVNFRKGDFFHELADSLNLFQEKLGLIEPIESGSATPPEDGECERAEPAKQEAAVV